MAINVKELHHHAVRIPKAKAEEVQQFYGEVLGLGSDARRPTIPGIPGAWMYVGEQGQPTAQIHLMGVDGQGRSPAARNDHEDPTRFHVALAVDDIDAACAELDRMSVEYWVVQGMVGTNSVQVFLDDPAGNMIELHQTGSCSCNRLALS